MAPRLFSLVGISLVICTVIVLLEATQLQSAAAVTFNGSGNPNSSRQISNAKRTSDTPAQLVHSTSDVKPALHQYAILTSDCQQGESVFQTTDYTENFGVASSSRSTNVNRQEMIELESSANSVHGSHHHVVFNPQRASKGSPVNGPPKGNPSGH
ncbi:unnamed protein product [Sphagnum jensenii]|uniref:Uncharacterized protein n=1 Tax=Sphagnum jensenii TaxID=128206 RepID=A0ABP1AQ07_9BRYO